MGRASTAISALILAIAIYFALLWGFDALRILTSPTFGLEDVWRSQVVFEIGRYLGLAPGGLLKLAALLGALKLTVAGVCVAHIVDRIRAILTGSDPMNEILETGLLIAVGISIVALVPAILSKNVDLTRDLTIQLLLAAIAAAATVIERRKADPLDAGRGKTAAVALAPSGGWFTPWRQ
ncbi:MAG: hypothetical protein OJF62_000270 [Pseudolabrys sp.]|jgi:hypothetical protein|nr:hypothetical protein [Pseudolabrys sp.]